MKPILIIDPGHGGRDPGGGSNRLWQEKNFVLQISLYQAERFRQLGVPVALTRTEDEYIDSGPRTKRVRDSGARFCISNHINAGGGRGVETIHSIYNDGKLAKAIYEAIVGCGMPGRRVFTRSLPSDAKKDYYFMHRETGAVSTIIVEYGFADDPDDSQRLQQNWKAYAEAVVRAFCAFVDHPYTPPAVAEPSKPLPTIQRAVDVVHGGQTVGTGYLIDGVSYAPVRLIAEAVGAGVSWDGERVVIE